MPHHVVVRSWKDPHFRARLPEAERARLPHSPAGVVEVPESDLGTGGAAEDVNSVTLFPCTFWFCTIHCTV